MGKRNFAGWMSTFRGSIADYSYYINFDKVKSNVDSVKIELNILNSLIGSQNIETQFTEIVDQYPETLKCIPLLLAVRGSQISATNEHGAFDYDFENPCYSVSQYCYFMRETGLFNLLSGHLINNLYDYATGVEAGLDSNARKNRGGQLMENLVEAHLKSLPVKYGRKMAPLRVDENYKVNLSNLTYDGKFDFVVETPSTVYGIKANFYNSGGSKLNETARSHRILSLEARAVNRFEFVWFTDGPGWSKSLRSLQEAFDSMPHIYNISDMESGIMKDLFV